MSIDLSLDRIRRLLDLLPPYTRPTIHVAGTNGKGSVCALVSSILGASSPPFLVGRFNSPHLVSVLDCICIRNKPISAELYSVSREEVERIDRENSVGASSFELLACTALHVFQCAAVDVVVLEVGMGGRLDATNAVRDECILVSALTAVDLDHQAFLGDTVEAIAREKAAIARPGRPFVIGPQVHPGVVGVVQSVVGGVGGSVKPLPVVTATGWNDTILASPPTRQAVSVIPPSRPVQFALPSFTEPVRALLPLHGVHQLANLQIAAGIISTLLVDTAGQKLGSNLRDRITPATVASGIQNTRWPGRLSYHTLSLPSKAQTDAPEPRRLLVLADGAHNPASATALADYLSNLLSKAPSESEGRPLALTFVLGLSHSPPKTPEQTLAPLFRLRSRVPKGRQVRLGAAFLRFTPPEGMPWVRSVPLSELRAAVTSITPNSASEIDIWPGLDEVEASADSPGAVAPLEGALRWAARRQRDREDALVVLAGSLYLVADFYRLLATLGQAQEIWGAN
ncbi:Mur ligase [Trametes meyenii]|nr:Mur ligase [Trametes meyenii]